MASATVATGLTVGCKAKSFPSWLEREKEFAPGVLPDVAAVAAELAELYVIAVWGSCPS